MVQFKPKNINKLNLESFKVEQFTLISILNRYLNSQLKTMFTKRVLLSVIFFSCTNWKSLKVKNIFVAIK